jgi:pSer/pThr/pTyr-binding forkhead associated (FHA) protein
MKVYLTIHDAQRRTVAVDSTEFLIGRALDCDLQLESPLISRHHCALILHDDHVYVRDLHSRNGTGLNNQPVIGERPVQNDDELWVAATPIKVHINRDRRPLAAVRTASESPSESDLAEGELEARRFRDLRCAGERVRVTSR